MFNHLKFGLSLVVAILIILLASCSKNNAQNNIDASLAGHWKFVGFISTQGDTTKVSLHTDCDFCMSIFISQPNRYFGRSYHTNFGRDAHTSNNTLVLKGLPPNTFDIFSLKVV